MKIEYDYTDMRTGPPRRFEVTVESDDEVRAAVGLLLTRALNNGELQTHHIDTALRTRPKYVRR